MDSDGSAKQQGTYQIKESTGGLIKPKTHLVNQVVIDVEHPLKTHSWGREVVHMCAVLLPIIIPSSTASSANWNFQEKQVG